MKYRDCFAYGVDVLQKADIADARIDAGLLLEYVCHTSRHDLLLHGDREVRAEEQVLYKTCIEKRRQRVPLQHITGQQAFMGFDFKVNEHVLIPRQDTEILVEEAWKIMKPDMRVLDLCTGSGCILLSLLALQKGCSGVGADISTQALKVALENKSAIEAQCGRKLEACFVESDLFNSVDGSFDMIVSNPPYIASAVIETLEPEVRLHEPMRALDGMEDGLYFYREIISTSSAYLKKGGALLFEIGYDQGEAVSELMRAAGFLEVVVRKDYAGLDRVVYGFSGEENVNV